MKWIILFVFCLGFAHLQAEKVCEPGSVTKQDCNTCKCSVDGTRLACTRRFCLPHEMTRKVKRETQEEEEQTVPTGNQVCVPDEIKIEDCNRCRCANNGIGFFCTKRVCPPKETQEVKQTEETRETRVTRQVAKPKLGDPDFTCTPGEKFLNKCNTCVCNPDGKSALCTLQHCISWTDEDGNVVTEETLQTPVARVARQTKPKLGDKDFRCTPGGTFMNKCNTCTCNADGTNAACTLQYCISWYENGQLVTEDTVSSRRRRDTPAFLQPGFTCTPGDQFPYECNICTCAKDGTNVSCTRKFCPPSRRRRDLPAFLQPGFTCTPGDQFPYECNTCTCGKDGKNVACTRKFCDRRRRQAPAVNTPGFTCAPRSTFKNDCNTCHCNDDGVSAACTYMLCPGDSNIAVASPPALACSPGETFLDYDKTCVCNADGASATCAGDAQPYKRQAPALACSPGETFLEQDQTCVCNADGASATCGPATLACSPGETYLDHEKTCVCNADGASGTCAGDATPYKREAEFSCEPGTSFQRDCNTCICSKDGKSAACTLRFCVPNSRKRRDVETPVARVARQTNPKVGDKDFRCTPGEKFMKKCNTCTCNADGTNAACTLQYCISWYENGQLVTEDTVSSRRRRDTPAFLQPGFTCTPGDQFPYECNTCTCAKDGQDVSCTRKFCPPSRRRRDLPAFLQPGFTCTPGDQFPYECNTCTCGKDGKNVACTRKFCDRRRRDVKPAVNTPGFTCTPRTTFKDDCNTCHCNDDGVSAACTFMLCPGESAPVVASPPALACSPGEAFEDYGKQCVCNADGASASCAGDAQPYKRQAPALACSPGETFLDHGKTCVCNGDGASASCVGDATPYKREAEFSCEPGTSFQRDCNTCICSKDGKTAACTLRFCVPNTRKRRDVPAFLQPGFTCTPGDQFPYECNTCTCAKDGQNVSCTRKFCPPSRRRRDLPTFLQPGFTCTPGDQFPYDCNTCTCGKNGKNVSCTRKFCDRKRRQAPAVNTPGFTCTPRSTFKNDCNTCHCNHDGVSAACTYMLCPGDSNIAVASPPALACSPGETFLDYDKTCVCNADGASATCAGDAQPYKRAAEHSCTPGASFKRGCNTCSCSADGKYETCTDMECEETTEVAKQECVPGTKFLAEDGCNRCFCTPTGVKACTFMLCPPKSSARLQRQVSGRRCTPGTSYTAADGCNTCFCSGTGHDACTAKFCLSNSNSGEAVLAKRDTNAASSVHPSASCTPGTSYKAADGCNTCVCSGTGHDVCTLKFCFGSSEGETLAKRDTNAVAGSNPGASCTPGTSYKAADGCNTCICSGTGHDVCTLKFCFGNPGEATLAKRDTSAVQTPKCVPGTRFMAEDGCNSCFCTPNGEQACTEMLCE